MMDNWIASIDLDLGEDNYCPPAEEIVESWAFIYVRPAVDPAVDRVEIERDGVRTTLVGVPDQVAAVAAAVDLVESGVQIIELCGILGPVWAARVIEATHGRVPVGAVSYGAESVALFLKWDASD
jgi:Family of unknown function (DUF6506)